MTNDAYDVIETREPVPGSPFLVQVTFREHPSVSIPIKAWVDLSLKLGAEISEETYFTILKKGMEAQAKDLAYRFLRTKARTVAEIQKYLAKKEVEMSIQRSVIAELVAEGLLNDAAYTEEFVTAKGNRMSRREMTWRLAQRGVKAEVMRSVLDVDQHRTQEQDAAMAMAFKYWRTHEKDSPERRREKLGTYLLRKGFPRSVALSAVRAVLQEREDI